TAPVPHRRRVDSAERDESQPAGPLHASGRGVGDGERRTVRRPGAVGVRGSGRLGPRRHPPGGIGRGRLDPAGRHRARPRLPARPPPAGSGRGRSSACHRRRRRTGDRVRPTTHRHRAVRHRRRTPLSPDQGCDRAVHCGSRAIVIAAQASPR
ncbi:MAG: hypothetical protein FGM58_10175, partial [Acidimicrobiia bacterium]|nr:hypothetical protein [Acidimicrobiia bacterium]